MSIGFCKIGTFSDGGGRIRIAAQGYSADPAPIDPRNIIYDSDWPEVLMTAAGYYGSSSANSDGSNTRINFKATLPFVPTIFYATPLHLVASSGGDTGQPTTYSYNATTLTLLTSQLFVIGAPSSFDASGFTITSFNNPSLIGRWVALLNDFKATQSLVAPPRDGTSWLKLSQDELVITKPGKDISSSSLLDYIIPPASMGPVLGQPVMAGTVSSIPWIGNSSSTVDQGVGTSPRFFTTNGSDYCAVIPHGLGYVPIVIFSSYTDFRTQAAGLNAQVAVDSQNVYIFSLIHPPQTSPGSHLAINTLSYFVLGAKWQ